MISDVTRFSLYLMYPLQYMMIWLLTFFFLASQCARTARELLKLTFFKMVCQRQLSLNAVSIRLFVD